jgi:hypothetical protein
MEVFWIICLDWRSVSSVSSFGISFHCGQALLVLDELRIELLETNKH